MESTEKRELNEIRQQLKKATMLWATDQPRDPEEVKKLRKRAALLSHAHYWDTIPYYQKICRQANVERTTHFSNIVKNLMIPDDIFKSYPQKFLDEKNFQEMDRWLGRISSETPKSRIPKNIDAWIDQLTHKKFHLVFSSGTSGKLSFVPRNEESWRAFTELAYLYLPQIFAQRGLLPWYKGLLVKTLAKKLSPDRFLKLIQKYGLKEMDGYFFNFSGGNQGIQLVGQETGKLTGSAFYLYDKKMSASAVRSIVRGAKNEEEKKLVQDFLDTTVHKKDENYQRLIEGIQKSIQRRRKVMLFGTPYLLKEICERLQKKNLKLHLPHGSQVVFGGGWKSFTGERIPEEELLQLISQTFNISKAAILEGYSMTEIQGLMLKCSNHRYHVPPFLEAVILDEELNPIQGKDITGTLGIIDPFADSYPGFLITGDNVRLIDETCSCGMTGPAIVQVERSPGKEVKGCGGIMASVNA